MVVNSYFNKNILLVDDDESILTLIETILRKEGYGNISKAHSGQEAISLAQKESSDLIILDIMLPDFDGFEICKQIRTDSMVPIVFLSAKSDESDKLISYALGGDAYITKPFSPKELIAKITAILKRQSYYENEYEKGSVYTFGDFTLDFSKRMLFKLDEEVILTTKEYLLLEYLIENRNITLSKDKLLSSVWNMDYQGYDNTVMVHIHNLREKIEEDSSNPQFIKTVKGRGYIFVG
ncbi:MAG: response regulator transcription factor [Saccharofermentans sp.]|nr:response regulator transcription factor [Saccharofermentans sp.]